MRPEHHIITKWLEQVDWDFKGPFPPGLKGEKYLFSGVECATGWPTVYGLKTKDECGT